MGESAFRFVLFSVCCGASQAGGGHEISLGGDGNAKHHNLGVDLSWKLSRVSHYVRISIIPTCFIRLSKCHRTENHDYYHKFRSGYLTAVNDMPRNVSSANPFCYTVQSIYQIPKAMILTRVTTALATMLNRLPSRSKLLVAPELLLLLLLLLLLRPNGRPWYEKVRFCLMEEL